MRICQKWLFEKGLEFAQRVEVKGMRTVSRPTFPAELNV